MNLRVSAQLSVAAALSAVFLLVVGIRPEQSRAQDKGKQNFDNVKVEMQPVEGNVYLLTGAGGNTTVQAGPDGVLIVDTQFAPMASKMLAAIRRLIRLPLDSSMHPHYNTRKRIWRLL